MNDIETNWKSKYIMKMIECENIQALSIKKTFMPEKLYKYESYCNYKIDTLRRKEFYLGKASDFNDPFDCKGIFYSKDILEEVVEIYRKRYKYDPRSTEMLFKTITDVMFEKAFVTCFSEEKFNMALWNFYADQHCGYCIEFDTANIKENDSVLSRIEPVIYTNKRVDISDLIRKWLLARRFDSDGPESDDLISLAICLLECTIKHQSWSYEKEWRYVELDYETQDKNISIPMPYTPSSIYLGKNFAKKNVPEMKEIARELNCKLFKMNDINSFGYDFAFAEEEV